VRRDNNNSALAAGDVVRAKGGRTYHMLGKDGRAACGAAAPGWWFLVSLRDYAGRRDCPRCLKVGMPTTMYSVPKWSRP